MLHNVKNAKALTYSKMTPKYKVASVVYRRVDAEIERLVLLLAAAEE